MRSDLILDTCTFLWLATTPGELTQTACRAIEEAGEPAVSAISMTEIHRLLRRDTITLPCSPDDLNDWFVQVLKHHALQCAPISAEVAHAAELLPWHHKDPADRFVIATAVLNRCPVVTPDEVFPRYGIQVIW